MAATLLHLVSQYNTNLAESNMVFRMDFFFSILILLSIFVVSVATNIYEPGSNSNKH